MVDSSFGSTTPNLENDESQWLLTRRFFLFDTISGIEQAEYPNGIPEIVRYPAKINLMVSLSQGTDLTSMERINVPVLKIEYKERSRSYLEVKDKPQNQLADVQFVTEYRLEISDLWYRIKWAFFLSLILCLLLCVTITCCQQRRPTLNEDPV